MSLKNNLEELLREEIISRETAARIRQYYTDQPDTAYRRLIVIFGVLGALLIGMGVILIMAYNWVDLSLFSKTIIAFIPLALAQVSGLFTLWKRHDRQVWQEGSGVAIVLGMGACLFLISQIYHFPDEVSSLLLVWMLLILPVVYLLQSGGASLLYITGITWHASLMNYLSPPSLDTWLYWLFLLLIIPYYIFLFRHRQHSFFTALHHWAIPVSLTIVLGGFAGEQEVWIYIAYFSQFGFLYLIGNMHMFHHVPKFRNGFYLTGKSGSAIMLIMLSFRWFWENLPNKILPFGEAIRTAEFWLAAGWTLAATGLLILHNRYSKSLICEPFAYMYLLFIACFVTGIFTIYAVVLINIILLLTGIWTIRKGNRSGDFTELNFGMLIFTVLIFSRFFDSNISFLGRGLAFILVGMGFFLVNYQLYRKKRAHEI